ncbi:MAG: cell division protein FtsL [Burkholderiales bacterium]|nr:cell division protein FtsL [Burkholderiales bacterium]
MAKFNIFLLIVFIGCAIGVVTSQHRARGLYTELQTEQDRARQFDVEWGQLQLEQSTWATHARIERIAVEKLRMQAPQQAPQAGRLQLAPRRNERR